MTTPILPDIQLPYSVIYSPKEGESHMVLVGRAPQSKSENGGMDISTLRWYLKPGAYLITCSWNGPESAKVAFNADIMSQTPWSEIASVPVGAPGQVRRSAPVEIGAETWMTLLPQLKAKATAASVTSRHRMVIHIIPTPSPQ